jgi:putative flavoprotein involved in K+ transport
MQHPRTSVQTLVIGGGQAGLAVGYHLAKRNLDFLIVDAHERIGGAWRSRWDSLRLFTPAQYDSLPGMPFPGSPDAFPTKDEMADYLEAYATQFALPVKTGVRVDRLSRRGNCFVAEAGGERCYDADQVIVAMSNWQRAHVPRIARDLRSDIFQVHAGEYRHPSQLKAGRALVVGAGNSGAEIAVELVKTHPTWLAGPDTGSVPFEVDSVAARLVLNRFVLRVLFHRLMTLDTPIGRKVRSKVLAHGMPLIRVKPKHLARAGVERVGRVVGVRNGLPMLEDERVVEVENVIWCTGFRHGFDWIDLPVLGEREPLHERGVVTAEPGLYFVGLMFLYAASSAQIHGVSRDAERIANRIAAQARSVSSRAAGRRPTLDDARLHA